MVCGWKTQAPEFTNVWILYLTNWDWNLILTAHCSPGCDIKRFLIIPERLKMHTRSDQTPWCSSIKTLMSGSVSLQADPSFTNHQWILNEDADLQSCCRILRWFISLPTTSENQHNYQVALNMKASSHTQSQFAISSPFQRQRLLSSPKEINDD